MPEITSVEAIRAKLHQFDERVDGAITAAKALAHIKADAEKLLTDIQSISTKSEQSLQKADGVRLQLQELHSDWEELKQQVDGAQTESKETRELLLSELDSAIQLLGKKVTEAEERLRTTNKASLAEQADLLRRLDGNTRDNADVAAKAQSAVAETATRLDGLLATLRDELHAEVHGKLNKAEELLESEAQRVEKYLEQEQKALNELVERKAGNHERLLREEMTAFKDEMKRHLVDHQQGIDRQLTDFLNKQNALVQNLSQQIDSFNRVTLAQGADLATTNAKLTELSSASNAHKATTAQELSALAIAITELRTVLTETNATVRSQAGSITALDSSLQATSTCLNETLEKLKQLPLLGSRFK